MNWKVVCSRRAGKGATERRGMQDAVRGNVYPTSTARKERKDWTEGKRRRAKKT
jgi:hypothetical protein